MFNEFMNEVDNMGMSEKPNVPTTNVTTKPPVIRKSTAVSPGSVKEKTTKTIPLYDLNMGYLNKLNDLAFKLDVQYVSNLARAANKPLSVDDADIPFSQLSEVMKNPDMRTKLISTVSAYQEDPGVDPTAKWEAIMNNVASYQIQAAIPHLNKKVQEQLYYSAEDVDFQHKQPSNDDTTYHPYVPGTKLITGDGKPTYREDRKKTGMFKTNDKGEYELLSPEEYAVYYINNIIAKNNAKAIKERERYPQQWIQRQERSGRKGTPQELSNDPTNLLKFISEQDSTFGPVQSKMNPKGTPDFLWNPSQPKVVKPQNVNVSKERGILPGAQKSQSQKDLEKSQSSEFWRMSQIENPVNLKTVANDYRYEEALKIYESNRKSIINRYNESSNPEVYKLSADLENKFMRNKGGEEKAQASYIEFDLKKPGRIQDGKVVPTAEIAQFKELTNIVYSNNQDAIYDFGAIKPEIPEADDEKATDLKTFFDKMLSDLGGANKLKGQASLKLPSGTITFQGIVGGDDKYHAFNVKINPDYLTKRDLVGTEEDPGLVKKYPELKEEGFTIYLPSKKSEEMTTFGKKLKQGKVLSTTEALLALTNDVTIPLPGAGEIKITRDLGEGTITVSGHDVIYNPETSKMDTIPRSAQVFQNSQAFDVDQLLESEFEEFKGLFFFNEKQKAQNLKLKGVKDPKQLQPQ